MSSLRASLLYAVNRSRLRGTWTANHLHESQDMLNSELLRGFDISTSIHFGGLTDHNVITESKSALCR